MPSNIGKSAVTAHGFGRCTTLIKECQVQPVPAVGIKTANHKLAFLGTKGESSVAQIGYGRCSQRVYVFC